MTAREMFIQMALFADAKSSGRDPDLIARRREASAALDFIDSMIRWQTEASEYLAQFAAAGDGLLYVDKRDAVFAAELLAQVVTS